MEMFDRLRAADKDWDMALVWARNRKPIGIMPTTKFEYHDHEDFNQRSIMIEDSETPDPFYDPQRDGPQPKVCTMSVHLKLSDVLGIDFIKYPKIIQMPGFAN